MTEPQEVPVYLRIAQEEAKEEKPNRKRHAIRANPNLLLYFDTETTVDEHQEMRFGICEVHSYGKRIRHIAFTMDLDERDQETITQWAEARGLELMSLEEFVMKIFYRYALKLRAVVVGFNLPFDVARIAAEWEPKVRIKGKNAWTLSLIPRSDGRWPFYPRLKVRRLDSTKAFMQFTGAKGGKPYYRGAFVDLRTLVFALTGKKHSLESARKEFQCPTAKKETDYDGPLTTKFLDYAVTDVQVTVELYEAALKRYQEFGLDTPPWRIYSSASLAKDMWKQRGVQAPRLPPEWEGRIMAAFYAGKVECRYVATSVDDVRVLDFTSQYPSLWCLLDLERFVTAEALSPRDVTVEVQAWLDELTFEDLQRRETWSHPYMAALCEVECEDAVLPVRSTWGLMGNAPTIGWSHVTTDPGFTLPYFAPDLIAAKLLAEAGRFRVIKATSFEPKGRQHVNDIDVLGTQVSAEDNLIQTLAEARMKEKEEQAPGFEGRRLGLKTLANSGSYGIFVEVNRKETEHDVLVHGIQDAPFVSDAEEYEAPGAAFCPIVGGVITSAAHLLLAMAEKAAVDAGGEVVYCDTDSVFVRPSTIAPAVTAAFEDLNPYNREVPFLKDETDEKCDPAEQPYGPQGVSFYGLSSKRYCLFTRHGARIHVYRDAASDHGLGGFKAPGKREEFIAKFWQEIIRDPEAAPRYYAGMPAIGDFALSSPALLPRVKRIPRLRPFSFLTARFLEPGPRSEQRSELIAYVGKDMTPEIQADLMSRRRQRTWQSIMEAFIQHRDRKVLIDADGQIKRHQVLVREFNIFGLGKETHRYEAAQILGQDAVGGRAQIHVDWERRLLAVRQEHAMFMGIPWETIRRWQKRVRNGLSIVDGHGSNARQRLKEGLARLQSLWAAKPQW